MPTLQEHCGSIGIISPTICGTQIVDCRQKIIVGTKSFMVQNTHVTTNPHQQKPLVATPKTITLLDPQQKRKQYEECERLVNEIFPVMVRGMGWRREDNLKQRDGDSCGSLVLLFFEAQYVIVCC
ncbi:hypothetical protein JG688_00016302 [Phytophthora aleatoria]|uniref:Uncharacterized protein n=1 Tax=Phytophthora aleatoria TaxID=2496075 RepID=A0A8J5I8L9_9STRA|nr:hypothetical protein JG688_00016302 [Phytophthora aleatoria]